MLGKRRRKAKIAVGIDRGSDRLSGAQSCEELPWLGLQMFDFNAGCAALNQKMDMTASQIDSCKLSVVTGQNGSPDGVGRIGKIQKVDGRFGDQADASLVF